ncbi:Hypothetical_protein [Hexamita inflata]|uniref:Hypothetical_protein n=1 Tax=Hexamita inflata TaxID=28002 RepID=A0AA86QUT8_9EUKA|nr:Hypothetical protein HINF_LOCUS51222 [Hexamita inflata]
MNQDEIAQFAINQNIFQHYQNMIHKNLQKELKFDISFNNSLIFDFMKSLDKMYYNRQLDAFLFKTRQTFKDIENAYVIEAENYNIDTKVNKFYDLDLEQQQQMLDQISTIYSQVLNEMLQTELSPISYKKIWEQINFLNHSQLSQFWALVSKSLNQSTISLKQFFIEAYQQVMFDNHLSDSDIAFINDLVDNSYGAQQPIVLVQHLSPKFDTIFYFEVFNAVHNQQKVNELKMTQTNADDIKLLESELFSTRIKTNELSAQENSKSKQYSEENDEDYYESYYSYYSYDDSDEQIDQKQNTSQIKSNKQNSRVKKENNEDDEIESSYDIDEVIKRRKKGFKSIVAEQFKMFTQAAKTWFKMQTEQDHSKTQIEELCKLIDKQIYQLDNQSQDFWKFVESQMPGKTISQIKSFYKATYKKECGQQLTDEEIEYIKKFSEEKASTMSTVEIAKQLKQTYFLGKFVQLKLIFSLVLQYTKSTNQKLIKDHGEQTNERITYFTQMYKKTLLESLNLDFHNKSLKEICSTIDSFNSIKQQEFWKYLEKIVEPKKTISQLKQYYKFYYQRVLYTDSLTHADKQYMAKLWETKKDIMIQSQFAKELMTTYFKGRDIFYYDVYAFANQKLPINKKTREEIKTNETSIQYNRDKRYEKFTVILQNAMTKYLKIKEANSFSTKQICKRINELDQKKFKDFFEYIQRQKPGPNLNTVPKLINYFKLSYQRVLYDEHLNEQDRANIINFIQNRDPEQTRSELASAIWEKYFTNRQIFRFEVEVFINSKIAQLQKQSNITLPKKNKIISQQLVQKYTEIYANTLKEFTTKKNIKQEPLELIKIIDTFDNDKLLEFFRKVRDAMDPNKQTHLVKAYYQQSYRRLACTYHLTEEDKKLITKVCLEQNGELVGELTKQIFNKHFKDKNLLYHELYNFIKHRFSPE